MWPCAKWLPQDRQFLAIKVKMAKAWMRTSTKHSYVLRKSYVEMPKVCDKMGLEALQNKYPANHLALILHVKRGIFWLDTTQGPTSANLPALLFDLFHQISGQNMGQSRSFSSPISSKYRAHTLLRFFLVFRKWVGWDNFLGKPEDSTRITEHWQSHF